MTPPRLAELCDRCDMSVRLSFCEQDNSRMRQRTSTKQGDPLEVVNF